jgi:ribosomal protein S18 acetylase RimI-like enzyme
MEPDGCFVAELDNTPLGTTATCVIGPVAWVALVLVDASVRGRGIGTALVEHALAYLEDRGIASIRLDATPLGQPIYEKLGFRAEYQVARFGGTLAAARPTAEACPVTEDLLPAIADLDREVTGADRTRLLTELFWERPEAMRMVVESGGVHGYLTARSGARALQIGPCAASATAGTVLLLDASQRFAGQMVFLDIPVPNPAAMALAQTIGLTVQRYLLRMGRGPRVAERTQELWASSGPEKG